MSPERYYFSTCYSNLLVSEGYKRRTNPGCGGRGGEQEFKLKVGNTLIYD